jgi:hypothetical protein
MRNVRNAYKSVVRKPAKKNHLGDLGIDGRTILKWMLYAV